MPYQQQYRPKRALKSFRDLDVYQRSMECAVLTVKNFQQDLIKQKFPFTENMVNCSMTIPLHIGESNSQRYSDFNLGVATLEKAMADCNKMIVYLEETRDICDTGVPWDKFNELIKKYLFIRQKTLNLQRSWKKYMEGK